MGWSGLAARSAAHCTTAPAYVQAVLLHLEAVGFEGAPRFLGVDDEGREILTYIEGDVLDGSPALRGDCVPLRG